MQLSRGMAENFNEPCDLIVTWLRAPLNPRVRRMPMLLVGAAGRVSAISMWCGTQLTEAHEVRTWGTKDEMRVWAVNVGVADWRHNGPARIDTPEDPHADIPHELVEQLLLAYPGKQETVADPCMGTGTVGQVVHELGNMFIGVERNWDSLKLAQARLVRA